MTRPPKPRRVGFLPAVTFFRPDGVPATGAGEIVIGIDEWETIRLKDYLGLDQQEAAEYMQLAQSTFQRILTAARNKLASAVVEGKAIRIGFGEYQIVGHWSCQACGYKWECLLDPKRIMHCLCPSCGAEQVTHHSGCRSI